MGTLKLQERVGSLLGDANDFLFEGNPHETEKKLIEAHRVLSDASGVVRLGKDWKAAYESYREIVEELGRSLLDHEIYLDQKYYFPFPPGYVEGN